MNQPPAGMELEEQFFVTGRAQLYRWLPWLHLFKAFRLAMDSRKMLVAFVAVCLWSTGENRLEVLWDVMTRDRSPDSLVSPQPNPERVRIDSLEDASILNDTGFYELDINRDSRNLPEFVTSFPSAYVFEVTFDSNQFVRWPSLRFTELFFGAIFPNESSRGILHDLLQLLWTILICGVFGGIVCRLAAVDFSGTSNVRLWSAISFSGRRWVSLIGAPLLACFGLGIFWTLNALLGLFARIPWVGDSAVGSIWIIPLLFGLFMALIAVGLVVGWPLMVAAVSTEATDSFDAISRAYSYIFNRPLYLWFLTCLMVFAGGLLLSVFCWGLHLMVHLAAASISAGLGHSGTRQFFLDSPHFLVPSNFDSLLTGDSGMSPIGPALVGLWMQALAMVPNALMFSYFWCSVTIMYFLLRLSEDGTPLSEVDLTDVKPRERAKLPLAGMAAARFREKSFGVVGGGEPPPTESSAGTRPE